VEGGEAGVSQGIDTEGGAWVEILEKDIETGHEGPNQTRRRIRKDLKEAAERRKRAILNPNLRKQ
jgi:hypothetical protein